MGDLISAGTGTVVVDQDPHSKAHRRKLRGRFETVGGFTTMESANRPCPTLEVKSNYEVSRRQAESNSHRNVEIDT